jgi:CRISPR-associated protein Cas2
LAALSAGARKSWLVAYDIRDKRRLSRLHRLLKREGVSMQYSAFAVAASELELDDLLVRIQRLIDERVDDVRAYHVPVRCEIFTFGQQNAPSGVVVGATTVMNLSSGCSPVEKSDVWEFS